MIYTLPHTVAFVKVLTFPLELRIAVTVCMIVLVVAVVVGRPPMNSADVMIEFMEIPLIYPLVDPWFMIKVVVYAYNPVAGVGTLIILIDTWVAAILIYVIAPLS